MNAIGLLGWLFWALNHYLRERDRKRYLATHREDN